jgi:small GTP-binding protein
LRGLKKRQKLYSQTKENFADRILTGPLKIFNGFVSDSRLTSFYLMSVLEFKVVVIGSVSVGKTAITNRLQHSQFEDEYLPTIGAGYVPWRTAYGEKEVELQIWDTAGMERYRSLGPIYYRDAAVIVYDQADQSSADALPAWLSAFQATVKTNGDVSIVGNKDDLPEKAVEAGAIRAWAADNRCSFCVTSAKTGSGVKALFDALVARLVRGAAIEVRPCPPQTVARTLCC